MLEPFPPSLIPRLSPSLPPIPALNTPPHTLSFPPLFPQSQFHPFQYPSHQPFLSILFISNAPFLSTKLLFIYLHSFFHSYHTYPHSSLFFNNSPSLSLFSSPSALLPRPPSIAFCPLPSPPLHSYTPMLFLFPSIKTPLSFTITFS